MGVADLASAEDYKAVPRLAEIRLRHDLLLDVVGAAVGGQLSATSYHPLSAGGLRSWVEATGQVRRVYPHPLMRGMVGTTSARRQLVYPVGLVIDLGA